MINPRYRMVVRIAAAATIIAAGLACLPFEWARIIGMTTLLGVAYGVLNDCMACRVCIEYFTIGHVWDEQRLERRALLTLNPWLTALACGTYGSWHVSALGGLVLAVACRTPLPGANTTLVGASQLIVPLVAGAMVGLAAGECASRYTRTKIEMSPPPPGSLTYMQMPPHMLAKWHACSARNSVGYVVAIIGLPALSLIVLALRSRVFN